MLLVSIIVVERIILNRFVYQHRLRQTIPMLHRCEPCLCRLHHIPAGYIHLRVMTCRTQTNFLVFAKGSVHDFRSSTEELYPICSVGLVFVHPRACLVRSGDGGFTSLTESGVC